MRVYLSTLQPRTLGPLVRDCAPRETSRRGLWCITPKLSDGRSFDSDRDEFPRTYVHVQIHTWLATRSRNATILAITWPMRRRNDCYGETWLASSWRARAEKK